MKRPLDRLLYFAIGIVGLAAFPLQAQPAGRGHPVETLRNGSVILTTEEEEQDAREIAAMINEAVNLHREVVIQLHNESTLVVSGRVTAQRYWLIVPLPDRSEIRFRASMIASVKLK